MKVDEISCREVVELVTEYLEGGLPPDDRTHFEEHLALCEGCHVYLEQMRDTIRVTGSLRRETLSDEVIEALCRAFRDWQRA
jgi:anti-sigma factor RsiW